jgi:hypothetical protein
MFMITLLIYAVLWWTMRSVIGNRFARMLIDILMSGGLIPIVRYFLKITSI